MFILYSHNNNNNHNIITGPDLTSGLTNGNSRTRRAPVVHHIIQTLIAKHLFYTQTHIYTHTIVLHTSVFLFSSMISHMIPTQVQTDEPGRKVSRAK